MQAVDCLWLFVSDSEDSKKLYQSARVQEWDWKLRGQLGKLLLEKTPEGVTIIPTQKKMTIPFIVIDNREKPNWEVLAKSCEGLRVSSVLCLATEESALKKFKTSWESVKPAHKKKSEKNSHHPSHMEFEVEGVA
jgi:hypothetical protein